MPSEKSKELTVKRGRSSDSSDDDFQPKSKKSCKTGEKVKLNLRAALDDISSDDDVSPATSSKESKKHQEGSEKFLSDSDSDFDMPLKFLIKSEDEQNKSSPSSDHSDSDTDVGVKLNPKKNGGASKPKKLERKSSPKLDVDSDLETQSAFISTQLRNNLEDKCSSKSPCGSVEDLNSKPTVYNRMIEKTTNDSASGCGTEATVTVTEAKTRKLISCKKHSDRESSSSDSDSNSQERPQGNTGIEEGEKPVCPSTSEGSNVLETNTKISSNSESESERKETRKSVKKRKSLTSTNDDFPSSSDSETDTDAQTKTGNASNQKNQNDEQSASDSNLDSESEGKETRKSVKKRKSLTSTNDDFPSSSDSETDTDAQTKTGNASNQKDQSDEQSASDSDLKPDSDSEITGKENKKKLKGRNVETGDSKKPLKSKTVVDNKDPHQNPKVIKLKKCLRAAGFHVKYCDLWKGCSSIDAKVNKMKSLLHDAGFEGTITLQKCKKFKEDKETEREIAELKQNVIYDTKRRSLRSMNTNEEGGVRSQQNDDSLSDKKKVYKRLKAVFDSDSD